jgi:hypothetical protein
LKWPEFFPAISVWCIRHCEERSDEAIQSFLSVARLDCFATLAMTLQHEREFHLHSSVIFFTVFVDGMFTTLIRQRFTKVLDSNAQKHSVHCL